jgi:hypothetical protein
MTTPLEDEVVPLLLVEPAPLDDVVEVVPELDAAVVPELEAAAEPELDVPVPELEVAVPELVALPDDVAVAVLPTVPLLEAPLDAWPDAPPLLVVVPGPAAS